MRAAGQQRAKGAGRPKGQGFATDEQLIECVNLKLSVEQIRQKFGYKSKGCVSVRISRLLRGVKL